MGSRGPKKEIFRLKELSTNDVIEKNDVRWAICIERRELSVARREGDGSDAVRWSALGCASLSEQKCNRLGYATAECTPMDR